jgi:LysM repeat protein
MLVLIGLAIILAAGLFLAVSAVQNRSVGEGEAQAGAETVMVAGQQVTLQRKTENRVRLVDPVELLAEQPQPEAVPEQTQTDNSPATETQEPQGGQPEQVVAPTAVPDKVILIDYTVKGDDSLYSIAQRIDTSIALMAQYDIAADNLVPGSVIKLPIGNSVYCPGRRAYAVGEGDTAFSIGRKFEITAVDLQSINNLDENYTVRVADILCVP